MCLSGLDFHKKRKKRRKNAFFVWFGLKRGKKIIGGYKRFFYFFLNKSLIFIRNVCKKMSQLSGEGGGWGPKKSALNDQKWHNCHQYAISTKVPAVRQQKCPLSPRKYPFCKKKCRFRPKSALSVQKKCPFSTLLRALLKTGPACPSDLPVPMSMKAPKWILLISIIIVEGKNQTIGHIWICNTNDIFITNDK